MSHCAIASKDTLASAMLYQEHVILASRIFSLYIRIYSNILTSYSPSAFTADLRFLADLDLPLAFGLGGEAFDLAFRAGVAGAAGR